MLGNEIQENKIKNELLNIGAFDIVTNINEGTISASLTVDKYCKLQHNMYANLLKCIDFIKENNKNITNIIYYDDFELIKVYGNRLTTTQKGEVLLELFSNARLYQIISNQFFLNLPIEIEFYTSKGKFITKCTSNEPNYKGEN